MKWSLILTVVGVLVVTGAALLVYTGCATAEEAEEPEEMEMAFGGTADVAFAEKLWQGMMGYRDWPMSSGYYEGKSPHGAFLRMYYNVVNVDETPYHVIVKDNFGGEGATLENVSESPDMHLMAVTVMVQREEGYDPEHNDWFYVRYDADGEVAMKGESMALAGRVGDGTAASCRGCHLKAGGGDYIFTND